MPLNF